MLLIHHFLYRLLTYQTVHAKYLALINLNLKLECCAKSSLSLLLIILVFRRHVLTAGHCMEDTWYVDILLGAVNLDTRNPGSLLMTSFNYQVHPGYDPSTLANDLAIVQLPIGIDVRSSRDIFPPSLITPLCLRSPASYLPSVSLTLTQTPVR